MATTMSDVIFRGIGERGICMRWVTICPTERTSTLSINVMALNLSTGYLELVR